MSGGAGPPHPAGRRPFRAKALRPHSAGQFPRPAAQSGVEHPQHPADLAGWAPCPELRAPGTQEEDRGMAGGPQNFSAVLFAGARRCAMLDRVQPAVPPAVCRSGQPRPGWRPNRAILRQTRRAALFPATFLLLQAHRRPPAMKAPGVGGVNWAGGGGERRAEPRRPWRQELVGSSAPAAAGMRRWCPGPTPGRLGTGPGARAGVVLGGKAQHG